MTQKWARLGAAAILLAAFGGCQYGTETCVRQRVGGMASCPLDVTPPGAPKPGDSAPGALAAGHPDSDALAESRLDR